MSEQRRYALFFVLSFAILGIWLFQQQKQMAAYQAAKKAAAAKAALEKANAPAPATPGLSSVGPDGSPAPAAPEVTEEDQRKAYDDARRETIRTGSLLVDLTTYGGLIDSWRIIDPAYAVAFRDKNIDDLDVEALRVGGEEQITDFPASQGVPRRPLELSLVGRGKSFVELNRTTWDIKQQAGKDGSVSVTMTAPPFEGVVVTKTLVFPPKGFDVVVTIGVENRDPDQSIRFANDIAGLGLSLGPGIGPYKASTSYLEIWNSLVYDNAIHVEDPHLTPRDFPSTRGLRWIGLQDQYFLAAFMLPKGVQPATPTTPLSVLTLSSARLSIPLELRPPAGAKYDAKHTAPYRLEAFTEPFIVAPGQKVQIDYRLFIGPKSRQVLKEAGGDVSLDRSIFYSSWNWFRALCILMMSALDFFYSFIGNWGLAIIMLTVAMKLITHPINARSLRITAEFQRQIAAIKPDIEKINKMYENDFQKKQVATMNLYKENGINPLAPLRGCLPMFIQLPIFVALYRIFSDYIVLRGATFLWVDDLSMPDQLLPNIIGSFDLNVLPLMMVGTQLIVTRLTTRTMEPSQATMMYVMPVMMLLFFYTLPAGLFLYWTMQNLWQIGHTIMTNKKVEQEAKEKGFPVHHLPSVSKATMAGGPSGSGVVIDVDSNGAGSASRVHGKTSAATRKKK